MTDQQQPRESVRWGWVTGCFVGGGLLIGLSFFVEARWNWQGVTPSVLVESGAALALAGVLFVLERRFTGRVQRVSERAAQQAAEQVEARIRERTDELASRLDDLQAEVNQRMRQRAEEQNAKIDALREDMSYYTVAAAMTDANRLVAIHDGCVTVPASHDPDGLALTFSWCDDRSSNGRQPGRPYLDITARFERDQTDNGRAPLIEVEWQPGEPAADVGIRLVERLTRAGRWEGNTTLDWGLALQNLQRALGIAMASRRRDSYAWHLHGALIELVGQTWAITDAGVESTVGGLVIAAADFPARIHALFARTPEAAKQASEAETWCPDHPTWADPTEWERIVRRARPRFPGTRLPGLESYFVPWGAADEHTAPAAPDPAASDADGRPTVVASRRPPGNC